MIKVTDQTGTLSPQAITELQGLGSKYNIVVTLANASSRPALEQQMVSCVVTPNMICIGVDPLHHFTATQFGVDTGVRKVDYQMVARAGNAEFHQGNWVEGVKSIIARAEVVSMKAEAPAAVVIETSVVRHETAVWPFFVGFGVLGAVVFFFVLAWRKRSKVVDRAIDNMKSETGELAQHNLRSAEAEDFDSRLAALRKRAPSPKPASPERLTGEHTSATEYHKRYSPPRSRAPVSRPAPALAPATVPATAQVSSATSAPAQVVVVNDRRSTDGDFVTGILVGEALASDRRHYREPTPEPRPRSRTPTPEPSYSRSSYADDAPSSSSGGGDSSSDDSSSSGGDRSSDNSSSGGGGSSDF